jgi:hypothetical protein
VRLTVSTDQSVLESGEPRSRRRRKTQAAYQDHITDTPEGVLAESGKDPVDDAVNVVHEAVPKKQRRGRRHAQRGPARSEPSEEAVDAFAYEGAKAKSQPQNRDKIVAALKKAVEEPQTRDEVVAALQQVKEELVLESMKSDTLASFVAEASSTYGLLLGDTAPVLPRPQPVPVPVKEEAPEQALPRPEQSEGGRISLLAVLQTDRDASEPSVTTPALVKREASVTPPAGECGYSYSPPREVRATTAYGDAYFAKAKAKRLLLEAKREQAGAAHVERPDSGLGACAHPQCVYRVHSDSSWSGQYCCKLCKESDLAKEDPKHGKKCEKQLYIAPGAGSEPAEVEEPAAKPVAGSEPAEEPAETPEAGSEPAKDSEKEKAETAAKKVDFLAEDEDAADEDEVRLQAPTTPKETIEEDGPAQ